MVIGPIKGRTALSVAELRFRPWLPDPQSQAFTPEETVLVPLGPLSTPWGHGFLLEGFPGLLGWAKASAFGSPNPVLPP